MYKLIIPVVSCLLFLCNCTDLPPSEDLKTETIVEVYPIQHDLDLTDEVKKSVNELFQYQILKIEIPFCCGRT
jgi:hypothetical protein